MTHNCWRKKAQLGLMTCCVFLSFQFSGILAQTLHEKIDAHIFNGGEISADQLICNDADYVKRVYLDFVGMIPSEKETLQFLNDQLPDKRARLVDTLTNDPRTAIHLASRLDIMLMERRAHKYVKADAWKQYLQDSIKQKKPLNQLFQEILAADADMPVAAGRFYLDREAEINLVTRDVGRIVFGRDLQCAQCHDHPIIADYYQEDYYGISAFLNRSFLFTNKAKKTTTLGEKTAGQVSFSDVFGAGDPDMSYPRLPGSMETYDPVLTTQVAYTVAPNAEQGGKPKHSRRKLLAIQTTDGTNQAFNQNMANRLWAMMLGRGLVEPLDMHHPENPATHPELLKDLANHLVKSKFDTLGFLKEIALSKTYQVKIDHELQFVNQLANINSTIKTLEKQITEQESSLSIQNSSLAKVEDQYEPLHQQLATLDATTSKALTASDKATQANQKKQSELSVATADLKKKQTLKDAITKVNEKVNSAVKLLSLSEALKEPATLLASKITKLNSESEAASKVVTLKQAEATKTDALAKSSLSSFEATVKTRDALITKIQEHAKTRASLREAAEKTAMQLVASKYRLTESKFLLELQNLRTQLQAAELAFVDGTKQSPQWIATLSQLQLTATQLKQQLPVSQNVLKQKTDELAKLEKLLTQLPQAITALTTAISDLAPLIKTDPKDTDLVKVQSGIQTQLKTTQVELEKTNQQKTLTITAKNNYELKVKQLTEQTASNLKQTNKMQQKLEQWNKLKPLIAVLTNKRTALEKEISEILANRFLLGRLRPLSPGQFAWSTLLATGRIDAQRSASKTELLKAALKDKPADIKVDISTQQIEDHAINKLSAEAEAIVKLYASGSGQPQDVYFATVDQALFIANSGTIGARLAATGQNTTALLVATEDDNILIDKLYLNLFSRYPDDAEKKYVAEYLAANKENRKTTIDELVWGLLSSVEFRFNR
ncbi:MAG: DUF1549 domain-containing protein [Pirellulales bacterium]